MFDAHASPPASATVRLLELPRLADARGVLSVAESGEHVPFQIRRARWAYEVPAGQARGGHAHERTEQLFVAVAGAVTLLADDGRERRSWRLDRPHLAVHVPPLVWVELSEFAPGTVVLFLASTGFAEQDYIRDHDSFVARVRASATPAAGVPHRPDRS